MSTDLRSYLYVARMSCEPRAVRVACIRITDAYRAPAMDADIAAQLSGERAAWRERLAGEAPDHGLDGACVAADVELRACPSHARFATGLVYSIEAARLSVMRYRRLYPGQPSYVLDAPARCCAAMSVTESLLRAAWRELAA